MDEQENNSILDVVKNLILGLQDRKIITQEDGRVLTKEELVDAAIWDLTLYRKYHLNSDNKKVITGVKFGDPTSND
ncbi:hypothetical protein QUW44_00190 [Limosilactobacillus pontis]|uniref:Uncharacterized protein n=1 Tax=Limosilactobacillus pontis TaxID=35787 RepID=A0ABT7UV69_9LACO|nr:hypothetical protein [Limosilactobacillus pontis]MDM8265593.1 hypothetical protein [Limosilactobacillus pontis]